MTTKCSIAYKSKRYERIVNECDRGEAITRETIRVREKGKLHKVQFDYEFIFDWSNGHNTRGVRNIVGHEQLSELNQKIIERYLHSYYPNRPFDYTQLGCEI